MSRTAESSDGAARALFAVLVGLLLVYAVSVLPRVREGYVPVLEAGVYPAAWSVAAVLVCLRAARVVADRLSWSLLGLGLLLYTAANVYFAVVLQPNPEHSFPTPADALWLSFYALAYAAIIHLLRGRTRGYARALAQDGAIAGLSAAAVVAAVAFPYLRRAAGDDRGAIAVNLLYPVADLVLIILVLVAFTLHSWRPPRTWSLLGGGLLAFVAADISYAESVATGTYGPGSWIDVSWLLAALLVAASAWAPAGTGSESRDGRPSHQLLVVVIPVLATVVSVGLLLVAALRDVDAIAVVLAAGATLLGVLRTAQLAVAATALAESRAQARTDELTSLPNRRAFFEAVEDARAGRTVAVVLVDLDRFKDVNDSLGHPAGDELLVAVAGRFSHAVRSGDVLARLGGDEFAVCCRDADADAATQVVDRLRDRLAEPVRLGSDIAVHVSGSYGIAVTDDGDVDVHELLQRADIALYRSKDTGAPVVYDAEQHERARQRLSLVEALRVGMSTGEVVVAFQPQVDLRGGVVGAEALVRWQHPERGLLAPAVFLEAAEQSGLLPVLTDVVVDRSLQACARWRRAGHDLTVSINLAPASLLDSDLTAGLCEAAARHGLPHCAVVLELTEDAVLLDRTKARRTLTELRGSGFSTSLDDFGRGWSSLSYLADLPLDEVKIDRGFVARFSDPRVRAIVCAVRQLARDLEVRLVAEGVEDAAQAEWLCGAGIVRAQGYHFARPMLAEELLTWIDAAARPPRPDRREDAAGLRRGPVR